MNILNSYPLSTLVRLMMMIQGLEEF